MVISHERFGLEATVAPLQLAAGPRTHLSVCVCVVFSVCFVLKIRSPSFLKLFYHKLLLSFLLNSQTDSFVLKVISVYQLTRNRPTQQVKSFVPADCNYQPTCKVTSQSVIRRANQVKDKNKNKPKPKRTDGDIEAQC